MTCARIPSDIRLIMMVVVVAIAWCNARPVLKAITLTAYLGPGFAYHLREPYSKT
jgi:hypothetical protein